MSVASGRLGDMDTKDVERWVAGYERAWRSPGTEALAGLFTADAVYSPSPYEEPVVGLPAIGIMWERERSAPDEDFTMTSEVVAVDGGTGRADRGPLWTPDETRFPRPLGDAIRRRWPAPGIRGVAVRTSPTRRDSCGLSSRPSPLRC